TIHYSLFVIRCITELHRVSVKRAPVAETRKGAGAGTPETGVATKADVPCLKAPLRHRASRPVCAKVTANAQHIKSGLQKYKKSVVRERLRKRRAKCRRALRERGNDCLILK
ncbi:MAG: hypothetical protein IJP65_04375, partial [Bacteroidales bacterium]|nr:hypothetical protein [Bacteroidales bacterium]